MTYLCPICDQVIHGTYCTTCKKVVKPYSLGEGVHLNERHSGDDKDCDYHAHTRAQEALYHNTDADGCLPENHSEAGDIWKYAEKKPISQSTAASDHAEVFGEKDEIVLNTKQSIAVVAVVVVILLNIILCIACSFLSL